MCATVCPSFFRTACLRHIVTVAVVSAMLVLSGCASLRGDSEPEENDPIERINRKVFAFNNKLDEKIINPVYRGYERRVPQPVRNRVSSFISNLGEPNTVVNDLLQGKFKQAADDTVRFILNSTVGLVGLFDVARHFGLEKHNEDFGQTFAKWGVKRGPFVMLPLFGPHNLRGAVGRIPAQYTSLTNRVNSRGGRAAVIGMTILDIKGQLIGTQKLLEMQLDPYIFVRESYRQVREQQIEE